MKLGLALSGGGFRAAFFHVGVLAQMAELGLLRHVDVLSTVSGGSILGALYYVHLKRLLEQKPDPAVTDDDYVRLVERIESSFLTAVQRNMRMRTFVNPLKNLRMARANYSRSDRLGEIFDELLYRPVLRPGAEGFVKMRDLKIAPAGGPPDFHPRRDNEARQAKVPILLLNATALNTGHNWRFEASTMGAAQRPSAAAQDVDKNLRLRRAPSYASLTPDQQDIELGLAVAASACVPALFHPLAVSALYPGIRVELVDGGVHDNQGVEGLLDEHCTHFVLSDASGQMDDEPNPATRSWTVLKRASDISMDRVREEELFDLLETQRLPTAFMHLRKGLAVESVPWIDASRQPAAAPPAAAAMSAGFGVEPGVQRLLSSIRTDLDSFTEIEAYSLMLDGYLMSEPEMRSMPGLAERIVPTAGGRWQFLAVRRWMATPHPTPEYLKHLRVGGEQLFKVFRLSATTAVATAVALAAILWLLWRWQRDTFVAAWNYPLTVGALVTLLVVFCLGFAPGLGEAVKWIRRLRAPGTWLFQAVVRGLLPALASIFVVIHLQIFDRLFLRLGRIERLR